MSFHICMDMLARNMTWNGRTRWTAESDACLLDLLERGYLIDEIATILGRTRLAIVQRIGLLVDEGFLFFRGAV